MGYKLGVAAVAATLLFAACSNSNTEVETTAATTTSATPPSVPTPPTAVEVFEDVSPAIAYVETDIGSGSAILIESGLLLTAAHVVWPYRSVRVRFPDGTEIGNARIMGRDLMADLALIDVSGVANMPDPVTIADGEALAPGSTVYMIGYPAETERTPMPSITQGILSRQRQWKSEGWTFLQSDATVVGGQSGGALVDENGHVIGVTNFQLAFEFGLSGSLTDVADRIDAMKAGTEASSPGDRLPPELGADNTHQTRLAHAWDQRVFVFEVPLFDEVEVTTNGSSDTTIELMTIDGFELLYVDENADGGEVARVTTSLLGPHLAVITTWSQGEVAELVKSTTDLLLWEDPDDGEVLSRPGGYTGNIDFPGDVDWFWMDLAAGQAVTITVDSVSVDPILAIDSVSNQGEFALAFDDNSGGGPFGTNPRVVFTAEDFGTFLVIVSDPGRTGPGAYVITVE